MSTESAPTDIESDMDLPGGGNGPCRNCGRWGHEHDKTRVRRAPDRWGYVYQCPDTPGFEPLLERFVDRIGGRTQRFVESVYDESGKEGDDS